MPDRDFQSLVALYLLTGILWAFWNSRSNFARRVAKRLHLEGLVLVHALAFVLAVLLWPLGLMGYALFSRAGYGNKR